jgi:hypothetical protein
MRDRNPYDDMRAAVYRTLYSAGVVSWEEFRQERQGNWTPSNPGQHTDAGTSDTIPIDTYPSDGIRVNVKRANVISTGPSTGSYLALHSGTVEGSTSGVERDMEQHVEEGH